MTGAMPQDTKTMLARSNRWVVKIGTSSLTDVESGLNHENIRSWVKQIAELSRVGTEVPVPSFDDLPLAENPGGMCVRVRRVPCRATCMALRVVPLSGWC